MAVNPNSQVFLFLSQVLRRRIVDSEGRVLGRISDLAVSTADLYPPLTAILYLPPAGKAAGRLTWSQVVEFGDPVVVSSVPSPEQPGGTPRPGELLLKDSLLDKQIVDTNGAKILRVNDLHLLKANRSLFLVHVDVGFRGLMRRVGLEKPMDKFFQWFFDYHLPDHFIPWRFVQPLSSPDLLRLKVGQNRLALLHPADLADIIEELDIHKRSEFFQSLDVETAAEALEETDPKIQVRLIENLNPAKASDIIEEMSPSEAADLLGDLPKEKAEGILKEMEKEAADDVKELLVHPEEKAGGLMTTAFPIQPPHATAREALEYLRRESENLDLVYYLYVADAEEHLAGVVSLRDLLVAPSEAVLSEIMDARVVSVELESGKEEIANLFGKYGLKAVPVVDGQNCIQGVIPFKSLLEIVAPELGK
jgi:magnesium transporter